MTEILSKELPAYNLSNPKTTIGDACKRRNLKKVALVNLHGNLANELQKNYGISLEYQFSPTNFDEFPLAKTV